MNSKPRAPFVGALYERNRLRTGLAAALVLLDTAADVSIAWFLQRVLDAAGSGSVAVLLHTVWMICGFLVVSALIGLCSFRAHNHSVATAMRQYKAYAFSRILKKNIRSFAEESTGRYISALTNDAQSVQDNYVNGLFDIMRSAAMFLFGLAMMLAYSWRLTLLSVGVTLLPMLSAMALGGRLTRSEQEVSARNERFVSLVKDLLNGFPVIKSFKAESPVARLFDRENADTERARRRRSDTADLIGFIPMHLGGVAQVVIFVFGALWTIQGKLTVGVVVAFVQLMNYLVEPVQALPRLLSSRKAAAALIDKLAESVAENADQSGARRLEDIGAGIALNDVSFTYPGADLPALRDVSLDFAAGGRYAIVGGSGSGKSTLLNLLLGSWDGYQGSITLGGVELREVNTESLYALLSVIQQNVFVFDSTVAQNIRMFRDFPEDEVRRAIRRAGLEQFIAARGEDYRCGENGSGLSGGEKQRISIARALLRGAPVLLMDEATSALDQQTAREVTEAILNIEGLTRIVVTHRLEESLLRRYDRIIVLRGGAVVEEGTFEALMEKKGYFYSLYNVAA